MNELRLAAAKAGNVRYVGRPCVRCGCADRYTASGQCCECSRVKAAKRYRKFSDMLKAGRAERDAADGA